MKRRICTDYSEILLFFLIPIIFGEFIFHKVYLEPVGTIDLLVWSIPFYNISPSFILKFLVFDLVLWDTVYNLFITREYYGFPYPEFICPLFAIITIFNYIFVIWNFLYCFEQTKELFSKDILVLLLADSTVFLPAIPIVVIYVVGWGYTIYENSSHKSDKNKKDKNIDEIFWEQDVIMPGETGYDSKGYLIYRSGGVLVCYIMVYRFIVLMNIRLTYWENIGILFGFLTLFSFLEYYGYAKQMKEDRYYLYQKISGEMHFQDGMNWKDLLDFQILELQRLKEIEQKYKHSRFRNIRWLELYEHMIVNDAKSIYAAIANWEDGIYSTKNAMDEIKPRILSIEKITTDCIPILPNSRKFNPQ